MTSTIGKQMQTKRHYFKADQALPTLALLSFAYLAMAGDEAPYKCEKVVSRPKQRPAGFTLLELLVVISVIAVLAALLLPSLTAAKAKTQSARCKSNLRQIAIAQSLYVTDCGAYPFILSVNWFDLGDSALIPGCPTASYPHPDFRWMTYDYGFNAYGFNGLHGGDLGWMGLGTTFSSDYGYGPVKEADVLNPCDMIAFSDSVNKLWGARSLCLGFNWIGAVRGTGLLDDTSLVYKRHDSTLNTAFADIHVESLKVDALFFSVEDRDRRRWFRDDQPHREWIE